MRLLSRRDRLVSLAQLLVLVAILTLHPTFGHSALQTGRPLVKLWLIARLAIVLALASGFLHARGSGWAQLGLRTPQWGRFASAVPIGLVAGFAIVTAVTLGLRQAGIAPSDFSSFAGVHNDLGEYLFWGVAVAWGAAAVGEELIFRGFAINALQRGLGSDTRAATALAILGQAVLFGALHRYQGAAGAITTGVIGLVLGLIWLGSGRNLWAGILTHGLVDCASMTTIYLNGVHH